ncbi:MAG: hypothetical protein EBU90_27290 [Proteobacteria bacterium]|nr:hypothetical protein [Pseudomonadota bacterium]
MLFLDITGSKAPKRRCESIVSWFIGKYLPRHKLDITINHRGLLREGVYGWCSVMDSNYRPRTFEIELHNRLSVEDYSKVLLHELQHVLQHVRAELDYEDSPWEIEAHQMESVLYLEYLTTLS